MKQTKYRFDNFSFHDFAGIARHLEKMAQKGWLLDKISPFYWRYRRIESKTIHFSVTYFSEASEFNPYPTPNQRTFLDYCADAGWNLAAEWAQMQVFWSEQENPVPIETDEELRLRSIHKSMKKNFIPSGFLMIGLVILQLILQFQRLETSAFRTLSDNAFLVVITLWTLVMLLTMTNLGAYFLWYYRAKKKVAEDGICPPSKSGYRYFHFVVLAVVVILFLGWVMDLVFQGSFWLVIMGFAITGGSLGLTFGAKKLFQKAEFSAKANLVMTIITCVFATIFVMFVVTKVITMTDFDPYEREPANIYTVTAQNGNTFEFALYRDELPLKVEDFMEVDSSVYSYEGQLSRGVLLNMFEGAQNAPPVGYTTPDIWYRVLETPIDFVYDYCLEEALEISNKNTSPDEPIEEWRPIQLPGCEGLTVYQRFYGDDPIYPLTRYIATDEDSIVSIRFGWDVTEEEVVKALHILADFEM